MGCNAASSAVRSIIISSMRNLRKWGAPISEPLLASTSTCPSKARSTRVWVHFSRLNFWQLTVRPIRTRRIHRTKNLESNAIGNSPEEIAPRQPRIIAWAKLLDFQTLSSGAGCAFSSDSLPSSPKRHLRKTQAEQRRTGKNNCQTKPNRAEPMNVRKVRNRNESNRTSSFLYIYIYIYMYIHMYIYIYIYIIITVPLPPGNFEAPGVRARLPRTYYCLLLSSLLLYYPYYYLLALFLITTIIIIITTMSALLSLLLLLVSSFVLILVVYYYYHHH